MYVLYMCILRSLGPQRRGSLRTLAGDEGLVTEGLRVSGGLRVSEGLWVSGDLLVSGGLLTDAWRMMGKTQQLGKTLKTFTASRPIPR